MASFFRAVLGGKKTLEQYRKERANAKNNAINTVDGVLKPTTRRITLNKQANTRFGVDLCRIAGRVFVLKVDETKVHDEFGEYLPGMRAGLSRFDELIQIDEEDIVGQTLPEIYQCLQEAHRINITVADRPLIRQYNLSSGDSTEGLRACLTAMGLHQDIVYTSANTFVPAGEALVEVNGELVLGVTLEQLNLVLEYAVDKCETTYTVSTMAVDVAASFLSAYMETASVFGSEDWKSRELLRKSMRHSKRRSSFTGHISESFRQKSIRRHGSLRNATTISVSDSSDSSIENFQATHRRARATNLDDDTLDRARQMLLA